MNALSEHRKKQLGLGGYVKRKREKNEATGQQVNKMAGKYKPESWNLRPGAEDHKQYFSLGIRA